MELADCKVIHGNSGSPIIDEFGQVRGIIQAFFDADQTKVDPALMLDPSFSILNIGTNFACLKTPNDPAFTPAPGCAEFSTLTPDQASMKSMADTHARIQQDLENVQRAHPGETDLNIEWIHSSNAGISETKENDFLVPSCIRDIGAWLQEFEGRHGYPEKAVKNLKVPFLKLDRGMDRYFRENYKIEATLFADAKLEMNVSDLERTGKTHFVMTTSSDQGDAASVSEGELGACQDLH